MFEMYKKLTIHLQGLKQATQFMNWKRVSWYSKHSLSIINIHSQMQRKERTQEKLMKIKNKMNSIRIEIINRLKRFLHNIQKLSRKIERSVEKISPTMMLLINRVWLITIHFHIQNITSNSSMRIAHYIHHE